MILLALVTGTNGVAFEDDSTVLLQSSLNVEEEDEALERQPPGRDRIPAKQGVTQPTTTPEPGLTDADCTDLMASIDNVTITIKDYNIECDENGSPKSAKAKEYEARQKELLGEPEVEEEEGAFSAMSAGGDDGNSSNATNATNATQKDMMPMIAAAAVAAAAVAASAEKAMVPETKIFGSYTAGLIEYAEPMNLMLGQRSRIGTPQVGDQCGFMIDGLPPRPNYYLACKSQSLPDGIPDLRGNWKGQMVVGGTPFGDVHTERIEQCGDRIVITMPEAVYDFPHADDTFENGLQDWAMQALPACKRFIAAGRFDDEGCFTITPKHFGRNVFAERRCMMSDGHLLFQGEKDVAVKMARVSDQFGNTEDQNGLHGDSTLPQEPLPAFVPTWPKNKEWESSSPENRGREGWGKANGYIKNWNVDVVPHPTVDPYDKAEEIKNWHPMMSPTWANKAKESMEEPKESILLDPSTWSKDPLVKMGKWLLR